MDLTQTIRRESSIAYNSSHHVRVQRLCMLLRSHHNSLNELTQSYKIRKGVPQSSTIYLKTLCLSASNVIDQLLRNFSKISDNSNEDMKSLAIECSYQWNLVLQLLGNVQEDHWLDVSLLNEIISYATVLNLIVLLNQC